MIRLDEVISSLDWSRAARLCHRSRPLGTLTAATHLGMQDCVESETKGCHREHNKAVSSAKPLLTTMYFLFLLIRTYFRTK